jgi:maltose O-acetyltransferase
VFANCGLVALDVAPIIMGGDVELGPNVQLLTPTHPLDPERRRAKWEAGAPIEIGSNARLGGGVIILSGVTIGADAAVGAGAVVTSDVAPGAVVAGNPERSIRR